MEKTSLAIVLSGHTMALGVVRALGEMKVPVLMLYYDERDMAHVSKYVVKSVKIVNPQDNERKFIQHLIDLSLHYEGAVIFPVSDETIVAVARYKRTLEQYYKVACPDWNVARKFIEKKYTYSLADANGVAAPYSVTPKSILDVKKFAANTSYPCLIKPSQSHIFYAKFKTKMFPVNDAEQLLNLYKQTEEAGVEVMLQEIIPGDDENVVNYNAYFSEGEPIAEFTSQHIRNAPPWWGSPRVVLSKDIPEIIEPGRKILRAMGFSGYACTEFKKDTRDGIYKLMEVNGRHNLSTLLAVRSGINFPWIEYQHHANATLLPTSDYKKGLYWIDIPRDVGYSLKFFRQEKYPLKKYLRPYLKSHVFANLDRKDIQPFITRMSYLFGQAIQTIRTRLKDRRKTSSKTKLQSYQAAGKV